MDWLPIGQVAISFVILALASWSDWRTREAPDAYWLVLGSVGILFLGLQLYLDNAQPIYYLILLPVAIIFYDIFWERKGLLEDGLNIVALILYLIAGLAVAFLLLTLGTDPYLWQLLLVPVMMVLFMLFYYLDIIKGGADAKALIALSIVFLRYPVFGLFPLIAIPFEQAQFFFPFTLVVLFNAALVMLVLPLAFFLINVVHGDWKFPSMLLGYRMDVEDAKRRFVWPMEHVVQGERKVAILPKGDEKEIELIEELKRAGAERIWVTPKVPFLIPITISLIFTVIVGNILFLFLGG